MAHVATELPPIMTDSSLPQQRPKEPCAVANLSRRQIICHMSKILSGLHNNASEMVQEELRLKIAAEEGDEARLQGLRDMIEPACQQADRGEFADYTLDGSLAKLRARS